MKAFFLTAGIGSRLRPLTDQVAKPAILLAGKPILHYSLSHFNELDIKDYIFNLHHCPKTIEEAVSKFDFSNEPRVHFSQETEALLGSGGALWHAQAELQNVPHFWLVNGDEVFFSNRQNWLQEMQQSHIETGSLATLAVTTDSRVGTQFGGVWADETHKVHGFGKKANWPHTKGWHFIGFYILSPKLFEYLPKGPSNLLYDALTLAIASGERVQTFGVNGDWYETGNPKDFADTEKRLKLRTKRP